MVWLSEIYKITMLSALVLAAGFTLPSTAPQAGARAALPTRREVFVGGSGAVLAWAAGVRGASAEDVTTKSGLIYNVVKSGGKGSKPVVGDLISIRFKCTIEKTGQVIDDIMTSPEPYYYRAGSGQVVPAIEEAVLGMAPGDIWDLTVKPELGFGTKGRNSSPGKPRIAGDAILKFTLQLDGVPGKDEELIEANGIID